MTADKKKDYSQSQEKNHLYKIIYFVYINDLCEHEMKCILLRNLLYNDLLRNKKFFYMCMKTEDKRF